MLDFFSEYLYPCKGECPLGTCIGDLVYDFQSGCVEETKENILASIKEAFKYAKENDLPCLKDKSFSDFKAAYRESLCKKDMRDMQLLPDQQRILCLLIEAWRPYKEDFDYWTDVIDLKSDNDIRFLLGLIDCSIENSQDHVWSAHERLVRGTSREGGTWSLEEFIKEFLNENQLTNI